MKSIKFIISSLFLFTAIVGCNDDSFLEEEPKTIYTTSTAFEKSSQVDAQLVSAYRLAFNINGLDLNNVATFMAGMGSDVLDNGDVGNGPASTAANATSNYSKWLATDGRFENTWNRLYVMISYANLTLQGAELVEWDDQADKEYDIAQAQFFRGYSYLRLAEMFGGVPIVEEVIESLKLDYERASREDTYKFAIEDLKAAAAALPDYPKEDGRVAKGVAFHFLAEAYLGLGVETSNSSGTDYTNAISAANQTIALHPLMTARFGSRANSIDTGTNNGVPNYKPEGNVYYDLFQIGNYGYSEGNTESVWTTEAASYDAYTASLSYSDFTRYSGSYNFYSLTQYVGPVFRNMNLINTPAGANSCPFSGNVDGAIIQYAGGASSSYFGGESFGIVTETKYLSDKVWADDLATDMRNDTINIYRNWRILDRDNPNYGQIVDPNDLTVPSMLGPMRSKIFMQDGWGWHSSQNLHKDQFSRDWYVVRSAETYLILAEAYLRAGNPGEAASAINVVRTRAQATKMYTDGDVDIYTILDERARELSYEERRWPTLLRMGSSLNGGSNEVMYNQLENNAKYIADYPYNSFAIGWTLFPVPTAVIQANLEADLGQNPGWN